MNPSDSYSQGAPERVDYRETDDVTQVHGVVEREHAIPETGQMPLPVWLLGLCALCIGFGAYYLGGFNGGFRADGLSERAVGSAALTETTGPAAGGGAAAVVSPFDQGKKLYAANCAQCHQTSGIGVAGQYPSLVGSPWVQGSPKRLAMLLLKGMQGPHPVGGVTYNGAMPSQEKNMGDKKIAAVLTYIRNEWGNKGTEIPPELLAATRKEFLAKSDPWTHEELAAVPEDAGTEIVPATAAP